MSQIVFWNDSQLEEFKFNSSNHYSFTLFLEEHPDYPMYLLVNSLNPDYQTVFKDLLSRSAISKLKLDQLVARAEEEGYSLISLDDPVGFYKFMEKIDDPCPIELSITLKKFQLQGFNLTKDLPSCIINWSTGTGKSIFAVARAKYLIETEQIDKVIICSKNHNKINWQRMFLNVGNLEATIAESTGSTATVKREGRQTIYQDDQIVIINYEKLRFQANAAGGDGDELLAALKDKRVFWAQPLDSSILTTSGWTTMAEIKSGISLPSPTGEIQTVIAVHPRGKEKIYQLKFSDGSTAKSTIDHLWTFIDDRGNSKTLPLSFFIGRLFRPNGQQKYRAIWSLPSNKSLSLGSLDNFAISPYIMGALLGDGHFANAGGVTFFNSDPTIIQEIRSELPPEYSLSKQRKDQFYLKGSNHKNIISDAILELGLRGKTAKNKFIPDEYLFTSTSNRLALLQGLLDTDGSVNKTTIRFCSISSKLRRDVIFLVRSLGGYARESGKDVVISLPTLQCFRSISKQNNHSQYTRYQQRRRTLIEITAMGIQDTQCITVSNSLGLYITDDLVITHNCWDEMPSKMKNMRTAHFRGAQKILHKTKSNTQVMLSATPIEVNPENLYCCMKILDPTIWPNLQNFRKTYAKSFSIFSPWQVSSWDSEKLKEMGMRISHITHQANKYRDPEISAEFPEEHWDDILIDMTPADRQLYDIALNEVLQDISGNYNTILTKISVLQMICNNPSLVNKSQGVLAASLSSKFNFTDNYCAKLDTLKDLLEQIDSKIVLFSMYNELGSKMLASYLIKWGHTFVLYDGSNKQKQDAQDRFKSDDRIKIFLSSDQGSDSINLEEATTVINYDLPWNYSTLEQRVNRINRLTSKVDHVFYYNLIMANTIEERKLKILKKKKEYLDIIFNEEIGEQSEILSDISLDDLLWLIK